MMKQHTTDSDYLRLIKHSPPAKTARTRLLSLNPPSYTQCLKPQSGMKPEGHLETQILSKPWLSKVETI